MQHAIKEANREIADLQQSITRMDARIQIELNQGRSWKIKQLTRDRQPYSDRLNELKEFIAYLDKDYRNEVAGDLLNGQCFCGLFVRESQVCLECGKPTCVLHSQGYQDERLCDDCRESE